MPDSLPNPVASSLITAPPETVNVQGGAPTSPTPQTSGNPLSGQQIPPQQMQQAPTQQQPTAAQHQVAQTVKHGLAWNALTGSHTEWNQTPQGPVPQQVPNKAQDLFRSILAGAIMGAGAPTVPGQNYANAGRGVAAATQGAQQQQERAQGQAQQQFQNKMAADKESREAGAAKTEETLNQARIAMYNLDKLKALQEIQGGSYTAHKGYVADAAPIVSSYKLTGLQPVVSDLSETDHEQYIKDHPGQQLDWQPTGVKQYVDPATNTVGYQTVWNAYNPKGDIKLDSATVSDWKKSGLLDMNPQLMKSLKKDADGNPVIPYSAFTSLSQQNTSLKSRAKEQEQNDYTSKHDKAELEHLAAQTQQEKATAAASGDEAALRTYELKQQKLVTSAQNSLVKSGNDWTKLKPEEKVALQPQIQKDIEGYRGELADPLLKEQLQSNDQAVSKVAEERAAQLHEQLDDARSHSIYVAPKATSQVQPVTFIDNNGNRVVANTPEMIEKATKLGYKKAEQASAPTGPNPYVDAAGHTTPAGTVKNAVQGVGNAIQNSPGPTPNMAVSSF